MKMENIYLCLQTGSKMLSRNRLKELIIALDLTKQLEDELIKDGAQGNSLSDKIKSYQQYDEDEFIKMHKDELDNVEDEEELKYQFRVYKRSLLDGRYNDLRWVAHERNQMMHFADYEIKDFSKFQSVTKDAISYFQNSVQKSTFLSQLINFITFTTITLIVIGALYLIWNFFGEYIQSYAHSLVDNFQKKNWIGLLFQLGFGIFFIYIAIQVLRICAYIIIIAFGLLFNIYFGMIELLSKQWLLLVLLVLSYFLWDKDVSYLKEISKNILKIGELL